jgi:hypothetical protein
MPDLTGFEPVKMVERLSPYSSELFEVYNGTLPYAELLK